MNNTNTPENQLLALVFRVKTGCRQYPFFSLDDLEQWAKRKPYRDDHLTILVFEKRREIARLYKQGHEAAEAVKNILGRLQP